MDRTSFLQNVAGTLAAASLLSVGGATEPEKQERMIGIPVSAVSFADEGVSPVLDEFQKSASVNTLFVATLTRKRVARASTRNVRSKASSLLKSWS